MRTKLLILVALSLAACQNIADPSYSSGTWKPAHVNEANLQAMIANPADLDHGHGDGRTSAVLAAAAIDRLRTDKVKPLATTGLADIRMISTGANTGGSGQ
nr:hypothetical protein [uncultured Rhodopila sp.]